jgi:hypothetical protein
VFGLLPVVAASCGAAAVFGVIAHRLGMNDAALMIVVRAVAAGVALSMVGAELIAQARALTEQSWGALGGIGRGTIVVAQPGALSAKGPARASHGSARK